MICTLYSPKMRPPSPISAKLLGPGRTVTPTGHNTPSTSHTPSVSGVPPNALEPSTIKNGANTPNYHLISRTASPLMSSLHPPPPMTGRPAVNGNGTIPLSGSSSDRDRDREREREWERGHRANSIVSPRLVNSSSGLSLPPPPPISSTAPVLDGR